MKHVWKTDCDSVAVVLYINKSVDEELNQPITFIRLGND